MVWPFFESEPTGPTPVAVTGAAAAVEDMYECDYERDCTTLYRAIEGAMDPAEFAPVVTFLDTGYWPGTFFADSLPPLIQAKTWVTRFDPKDPSKVKWSQLPLHLAIVCNAPVAIIGRLVKLYPQALRCTDDQHMLPLHLALRHGASDEVISFMLLHFPEAVNAKGKNGRTAIDCSLRAKDKLRGKILQIFVERSKGKKSAAIVKEQTQLKEELALKINEGNELRADIEEMATSYESIKAIKETIELDLLKKIQDLEQAKAELEIEAADKIERLENEKLVESVEHNRQLEVLKVSLDNATASDKQSRATETALRKELESLHGRVAKSLSPEDWKELKIDVRSLEANRLERSRTETKVQIDTLKEELEQTIWDIQNVESNVTGNVNGGANVKGELKSELKTIQQTVSKLERTETKSKSKEELNVLRSEIEALRFELKDRAEASRTRVELTVLKKAMEIELRNAQGKTEAELAALRQAVEATKESKLEEKTTQELASLKKELDSMKKEIRNKELVSKTKTELEDLCMSLEAEIATAGSNGQDELAMMKKTADELKTHLIKSTESDVGIVNVNKSVKKIKDDLKKKDTTAKILEEVTVLKSTVEAELKTAEGKTQKELLQVKQHIKSLNEKELGKKDVDELIKVKGDVAGVKANLKAIEKASRVQQELDFLKKTLAKEMLNTAIKAERELTVMKKAVDEVNMEQKESKKIKKELAEEIKEANKQTEQKLLEMKKALDGIDAKKLDSSNKEGWDAIRAEIDTLKTKLAEKQASRDVSPDVDYIKKTLAALNLENIESKTNSEFKTIREEMNVMRATLKEKDQGEKELKKELESLKKTGSIQKKKGLKKFFTRHFAHRKNNEVDPSIEEVKAALAAPIIGSSMVSAGSASVAETTAVGNVSKNPTYTDEVFTIGPPSMANTNNFGVGSDSDDSCSDDEVSQSDGDVLAKLSVSFVDDAVVPAVETTMSASENSASKSKTVSPPSVKTTGSTKSQAVKKGSLPPIVPRKVHSMEPRIASPASAKKSTSSMVRKFSNPIIEQSGDELEKMASCESLEDDVLVKSPSYAAAVAAQ